MNDLELLELSAKAYGFQVKGSVNGKLSYFDPITEWSGIGDWNPLKNDGDAMRLAVKLEISFCRNHELAFAQLSADPSDPEQSWGFSEELLSDPFSATRRAIVRAAADIGKSL